MAKDPVCGMTVDPHTAKHRHNHDGHPYYFCSAKCREKFIAEPSKYLKPVAKPAAPKAAAPAPSPVPQASTPAAATPAPTLPYNVEPPKASTVSQ